MTTTYCSVQDVAEFLTQLGFSNPAVPITAVTLVGVTPVNITAVNHEFVDNDTISLIGLVGAPEINGNSYQITYVDQNHFTLDGTNSALVTPWVSGGEVYKYGELDEGTWPDKTLVQRHIDLAASEINITLMASDQFTCTKSAEMQDFLRQLNLIGAMLLTEFYNARVITAERIAAYQTWYKDNLALIRLSQLAVCEGETGSDYPAIATAEVAYTPEAAAKIYINRIMRTP